MIDYEHRPEHWRLTRRRGLMILAAMFLTALLAPLGFDALDQAFVLRLPVSFYLAAQGLIIVFIVLVFWFAASQERADRRYGATED